MGDMKVLVDEGILRKAAQMLMNKEIHYQVLADKARTQEHKERWMIKALKVAGVHEAICRALIEAEEQEV